MKALILGGTGMLGYPTALELLKRGYRVEATARQPVSMGAPFDNHVKLHPLDIFTASAAELNSLMLGVDALVYALGPDDRETPVAPASAFFQQHLVDQTERVISAARRSGVRRAVVMGSYFCTFHREHPEWQLAQHHPYVRARVQQAELAIAAGEGWGDHLQTDVMFLEIPYVFGVTPGRTPFWKTVLFERLRKMPIIMYPKGGTVMMTSQQIAQAVAGAIQHGQHGQSYPVGDRNMDWHEMIGIIQDTLGERKPVLTAPMFLSQRAMRAEQQELERQGLESGMDPMHLMQDVMYRHLYINPRPSQELLGIQPGGVEQALRETVEASYPERIAQRTR